MHQVYISLGSNVGNREGNLAKALRLIQEQAKVVVTSAIYETEAWGRINQPPFFNQVVLIETVLEPQDLLEFVKSIESKCGRKLTLERFMPRTIDIDILFYDNRIYSSEELKIPHPLIHERKFVLIPMVQIAPTYVHPVLGRTILQLLGRCTDELTVRKV